METVINKNAPQTVNAANIKNGTDSHQHPDPLSAKDRLLAVLKSTPLLDQQDAELIDRVVMRAREESLIGELSA